MDIMFSDGIDYTTCLIIAGVDTLATRREYLTKRFFCQSVLPETAITNKLSYPKTFQSLTVKPNDSEKLLCRIVYVTTNNIVNKMVKTGQFTTKCKGNKVIALKLQKSLWWDSA